MDESDDDLGDKVSGDDASEFQCCSRVFSTVQIRSILCEVDFGLMT